VAFAIVLRSQVVYCLYTATLVEPCHNSRSGGIWAETEWKDRSCGARAWASAATEWSTCFPRMESVSIRSTFTHT